MVKKKKVISAKWVFVIVLVAVLGISSVYAVTYIQNANKPLGSGVHVGDTFYYNVTGAYITFTNGTDPDEQYPGITQLNQTDHYKVAVTGVEGSVVSLSTDWVFKNGTDINQAQTINLENGNLTDPNGFCYLYAPNLKVTDLLCPKGGDSNIIVNDTITRNYASGSRPTNYWTSTATLASTLDPTSTTYQINTMHVLFDKQTGIMTGITNYIQFNNPQMNVAITWTITSSTLWKV